MDNRYYEFTVTTTYTLFVEKFLGSFLNDEISIRIGKHIGRCCYPIAGYVLKKQSKKCSSVEDILDLAFNFQFLGINIRPFQVKEEIANLLQVLESIRPKVILEIGTACGGTLFLFSKVASGDGTIISVDLQEGFFPNWKTSFYRLFHENGQKLYLLKANSHDVNTIRSIEKILGNFDIDFLFIDGDHSYEGVKKDFEMYSPLVRSGGIIALHDIVPGPPEYVGGVPKFWKEVKRKFNHMEFVSNKKQQCFGIGLLYV